MPVLAQTNFQALLKKERRGKYLVAYLIEKNDSAVALSRIGGQLAQSLAHQPSLCSHWTEKMQGVQ